MCLQTFLIISEFLHAMKSVKSIEIRFFGRNLRSRQWNEQKSEISALIGSNVGKCFCVWLWAVGRRFDTKVAL